MRTAEWISAQAIDLREKCGVNAQLDLDVMQLLRSLERTTLPRKGRLKTFVHNDKPLGYKAYVKFDPLELHVEKLTFERARWGQDFSAKYIICHELGHVVLHDGLAVPFSEREITRPIFGAESGLAEDQANRFADQLLLPDHILSQFGSIESLIDMCQIGRDLAERRFPRRRNPNLFRQAYVGEFCLDCQTPSLLRRGLLLQCDNCGASHSGL